MGKIKYPTLIYKPKNSIEAWAYRKWRDNLMLKMGNDYWESASISLVRKSITFRCISPSAENQAKPMKTTMGMGMRASRWDGSIAVIESVVSIETFMKRWECVIRASGTILKDIDILATGHLNNAVPTLHPKGYKGHILVETKDGLPHLGWTVRSTPKIGVKYLYFDDEQCLIIPISYLLKAADDSYEKFCDPFADDKNKTLQYSDKARLITCKWEETYKEE